MPEKEFHHKEQEKLKSMVRSISDGPELQDLPILFCREETRYDAHVAAGFEPSPAELSRYFWNKDMNAFTQKSLPEHLSTMGDKPKAVLATLLALSAAIGTTIAITTDDEALGAVTAAILIGATLAGFRRLIQISLASIPVSEHTKKFYADLKKVYKLCQKLQSIPSDASYLHFARALAVFQEAQELIIAMQRELEDATRRVSGTYPKANRSLRIDR